MFYSIVILLLIVPKLVMTTLEVYSFINTDEVENIYQANQGTWYLETEKNLEKMLNKHPGDTDLLLSLGLMSKRRRDFGLAKDYSRIKSRSRLL